MTSQPQCTDKRINLHINSGNGFALIKGAIMIHATLMKENLQTLMIPVNKNMAKFDSKIIWNVDNAKLKELKVSNANVRIECFHTPINKSSLNVKLGYLLLKLKDAQFFNPTSNDRVVNKTYKLLGSKNCCYYLTISVYIEDFYNKNIETMPKTMKSSKLMNNKNINIINDDGYHLQKEENDDNVPEQIEYLKDITEPENVCSFNEQGKIIEELEDWKDKQMILFNEKLKIKEEQLLKELNNKWLNDRKRIEEDLTHEVSKCKALTENMEKVTDMLIEREAIVTIKELELICLKNSMDNKSSSSVENDLEKSYILLRNENDQLKDEINSNYLQIHQLEKTISNLESKFQEANESCMYNKERWIASVRKINQIYNKLQGTKINEQLTKLSN